MSSSKWSLASCQCETTTNICKNIDSHFIHAKVTPKVTPPVSLCWLIMSVVDVGCMAVEFELSMGIPSNFAAA